MMVAIELYPTPDAAYTLKILARTGIQPFAADTDVCSIDHEPLFLFALALAKDHYLNAGDKYAQMARRQIAALTGRGHAGRRYIPEPDGSGLKAGYGGACDDAIPPVGTWRT